MTDEPQRGRHGAVSSMTGIQYAVLVAGMRLSFPELAARLGCSPRQAQRYAAADHVPEWVAQAVGAMHTTWNLLAIDLSVGEGPVDADAVPEGLTVSSWLACIHHADQMRFRDGQPPRQVVRSASGVGIDRADDGRKGPLC